MIKWSNSSMPERRYKLLIISVMKRTDEKKAKTKIKWN